MSNIDIITSKDKKISIMHINSESFRNKIHEFDAFLADKNYDYVCVTEHWFKEQELESINIKNYVIVSSYCRKSCKGGGALILTTTK